MIRKVLEKVFITKKCTQLKTLDTLKTNGNLLSKHELFFLDQANFSADQSQILIHWILMSFPASLAISIKLLPGQLKLLCNPILIMFFICFPNFFYPIRPHATIIGYSNGYAKSNQSNLLSGYMQIIIPYWINMLPIKKLSL